MAFLVVEGEHQTKADPLKANDAVQHLRHHGVDAVKYRAVGEEDDTADILVAECRSLGTNLLVMGSYGHRPAPIVAGQHDQPNPAHFAIPPAHRALTQTDLLACRRSSGEGLTVVKATP